MKYFSKFNYLAVGAVLGLSFPQHVKSALVIPAKPSSIVQDMIDKKDKSGQQSLCVASGIIRKKPENCGAFDFAMLVIGTCEMNEEFKKSQCATKMKNAFKASSNPGVQALQALDQNAVNYAVNYLTQAVKENKTDPTALICGSDQRKLEGGLSKVSTQACSKQTSASATGTRARANAISGTSSAKFIVQGKLKELEDRTKAKIIEIEKFQLTLDQLKVNVDKELTSAGKTKAVASKPLQQDSTVLLPSGTNNSISLIPFNIKDGIQKPTTKNDLIKASKDVSASLLKLKEILNKAVQKENSVASIDIDSAKVESSKIDQEIKELENKAESEIKSADTLESRMEKDTGVRFNPKTGAIEMLTEKGEWTSVTAPAA